MSIFKHFCLSLIFAASLPASAGPKCHAFVAGHGPDRLVTFGDSQTAGHATENAPNCGESWANLVSVSLNRTLYNTAVGGSEFVSLEEFGALMAMDYNSSDLVMGLVGYNDMVNHGVDPDQLKKFKATLAAALKFISPKVKSITLGTCLTPIALMANASPAAIALYRQATKDVVKDLALPNITVIDVDGGFAGDPNFYISDKVHLNLRAQEAVAIEFEKTLAKPH